MTTKTEAKRSAGKAPVKRFRAVVKRKEGGEVCSIDEEAKRPETRLRRIEKSIELLAAGRKEGR